MMAEMPAREFDDWLAVYENDPWGEERDDRRMARVTWAIFQAAAPKAKLKEAPFMLDYSPKRPLTPEEYKRKSMRAYAGHGGGPSIAAATGSAEPSRGDC
jgi:hypothetical protein